MAASAARKRSRPRAAPARARTKESTLSSLRGLCGTDFY